ncbi:MAG: PleD family two-component system response regulator [Burkholderiaceae bacterium]
MSEGRTLGKILVASDDATDAALVRKLLAARFEQIVLSTDSDKAVEDFDQLLPDVLVLAFGALAKAERYYLGLYRFSSRIHAQTHRTVILCDKAEVVKVSELCMKRYFDDYVLFWPMNHDAPRLPMAVHHALRELDALRNAGPSSAEFAAQARRLVELEALLGRYTAAGAAQIDSAQTAIDRAERGFNGALAELQGRFGGPPGDTGDPPGAAGIGLAIAQLGRDHAEPMFEAAAESIRPLAQLNSELQRDCAPYMESIRTLGAMAGRIRPKVLMVDDDALQKKIVAAILPPENYELLLASDTLEAMALLRTTIPDLILMDVMMPSIDGIETTRRLKAAPLYAKIPVIMVTGESKGSVVRDCLEAGAIDFVVKPFDRRTLLGKIQRLVGA